jgi:hypothetical protein
MNDRFESLLRLYDVIEWQIRRNPIDFTLYWERDIIYGKMLSCIPQSHYDEINLIVYGIRRL